MVVLAQAMLRVFPQEKTLRFNYYPFFMILLFEGHKYPSDLIGKYISELKADGIKNGLGWTAINYVGYFYCKSIEKPDIVYVLPKVFIYNNKYVSEKDVFNDSEDNDIDNAETSGKYLAFGEFEPEKLVNIDDNIEEKAFITEFNKYKYFIQQLTIWIYRTVHRYHDRMPQSKACISSMSRNLYSNGKRKKPATWLDYILSLCQFAYDNKSFFTFVYKQAHSGYNKVNWKKTINNTLPIINNGKPIYIEPITKKKTINYDEELLVILFSALQEIKDKYDFPVYINADFNLMTRNEFARFKRNGKRNMLNLKYKYFSDKTIELWNLLYSYFELSEDLSSNKTKNDYLLVNSFQVVFEDMIDYLISDEPTTYPKELKKHYDGKQIDHIYRDNSLVYDTGIYYVGDSKYYPEDSKLEKKSVKKQYTYAKNIIQRNIDVIKGFDTTTKNEGQYLNYRDEDTEGYNITPNFFISGIVNRKTGEPFDFTNDNLNPSDNAFEPNMHFRNRLFDRDTLILQRYNINFLFVLSLYARHKEDTKLAFREKARRAFKDNILAYLETEYAFYKIDLNNQNKSDFIEENLFYLKGKIFSIGDDVVLLAWKLNKNKEVANEKFVSFDNIDNNICPQYPKDSKRMIITPRITKYQKREFVLLPWSLKDRKVITTPNPTILAPPVVTKPKVPPLYIYDYDNDILPLVAESTPQYGHKRMMLVGCYKSKEHLKWILQNQLYNVRLGNREGAMSTSGMVVSAIKLLLYNYNNPDEYQLFELDSSNHILANNELMKQRDYPELQPGNEYLLYVITGESADNSFFDVESLKKEYALNLKKGAPFYVPV